MQTKSSFGYLLFKVFATICFVLNQEKSEWSMTRCAASFLFFLFKFNCVQSFDDCYITIMAGMVVFRIKGENDLTERLLKRLNHRGFIHCVPASLKGKYVIRYENRLYN